MAILRLLLITYRRPLVLPSLCAHWLCVSCFGGWGNGKTNEAVWLEEILYLKRSGRTAG